MSTTTEALVTEAKQYKNEIHAIYAVQAYVRMKAQVPLNLAPAVAVLTNKGHLRWSERAGRLMFTPEGAKFAKAAKRFGPRLGI